MPIKRDRGLVIVADDDRLVRAVCREALESAGFDVAEAADGDEVHELLAGGARPVAVVLDIMMPGRTGWATVAEIKKDPELSKIAIVMLTAQTDLEWQQTAKERGVSAYVTKPFDSRRLAGVVRSAVFAAGDRWERGS